MKKSTLTSKTSQRNKYPRGRPVFMTAAMQLALTHYAGGKFISLLKAKTEAHLWFEVQVSGDAVLIFLMNEFARPACHDLTGAKIRMAEITQAMSTVSASLYSAGLDEQMRITNF